MGAQSCCCCHEEGTILSYQKRIAWPIRLLHATILFWCRVEKRRILRQVHEAVTKCIDAAVKARSQRQKASHLLGLLCQRV